MREPVVSIVTPSLNQGRFIRATIESVLSQDYPHIEYIIIDGGSTDETESVVRDYASRLTWISEKDRGQSHAINKGFRMAKGEIVSWINSDDIILPGAVAKAVEAMKSHPEAGAVYGEGHLMNRSGEFTGRFPRTEPLNLWKLVHLYDYILQQTLYFRKSVLDEVGYLDEDLHYAMDWDILIRIAKRHDLQYIPEYMGCLREYPEAKSFAGGAGRIREIKRLLRKHTGLLYPAGYIVYGLEAYRKLWCDWLEAHTPAALDRLRAMASRLIWVGCGYWIERTLHRAQGWYPDGWAGVRVRLLLPPSRGRALILRGKVPALGGSNQQISIRVEQFELMRREVAAGDFEIECRIPAEFQERCISVAIIASKFSVRGDTERSLGRRKLAYILKEVGFDNERSPTPNGMPKE